MKKVLFSVLCGIVMVSFAFSGYQVGRIATSFSELSSFACVFGAGAAMIIGFVVLFGLHELWSDKEFFKSYISAEDLSPGLYKCLTTASNNHRKFHLVVSLADSWSTTPLIVEAGLIEHIPEIGEFEVSPARKVIRSVEDAHGSSS